LKQRKLLSFSSDERHVYESSLKYYRGIKNVVDTSKEEGIKEGKQEEKTEIAIKLTDVGLDNEMISSVTGLPEDIIDKLRNN